MRGPSVQDSKVETLASNLMRTGMRIDLIGHQLTPLCRPHCLAFLAVLKGTTLSSSLSKTVKRWGGGGDKGKGKKKKKVLVVLC